MTEQRGRPPVAREPAHRRESEAVGPPSRCNELGTEKTTADQAAAARADEVLRQLRRLPHELTTAASGIRDARNAAVRRRAYYDATEIMRLRLIDLLGLRDATDCAGSDATPLASAA